MKPLAVAWLSLIHNRRQFVISLAGVAFSVLLMFIETGFLNGVYDSQTLLADALDADLVMMNRQKEDLLPVTPFSRRRLEQAQAVDGVRSIDPLYMEEYYAFYKTFDPDRASGVVVLAFNPYRRVLSVPGLDKRHLRVLTRPDTALIDAESRDLFGPRRAGVRAELNGRALTLSGTFDLGPNFRTDGFLIMSDQNFFRYFPDKRTGVPDPDRIELGLIRVREGHSVTATRDRLNRLLPDDVVVVTRAGLAARIRDFWRHYQPVGVVFAIGAAIGFLIGIAVCYQILYTDITDNLAQYATLKAIGSEDGYIIGLVTRKAVLLGILGFVAGLFMSTSTYEYLQSLSGITMRLDAVRGVFVLLLSVLMCVIAGLLAVRRVLRFDPAELF